MAAVTITDGPHFNVNGSYRENYYRISGATGGTFITGLNEVKQVSFDLSTITGYTVTRNAGAATGNTITITSSGAYTNVNVTVLGH